MSTDDTQEPTIAQLLEFQIDGINHHYVDGVEVHNLNQIYHIDEASEAFLEQTIIMHTMSVLFVGSLAVEIHELDDEIPNQRKSLGLDGGEELLHNLNDLYGGVDEIHNDRRTQNDYWVGTVWSWGTSGWGWLPSDPGPTRASWDPHSLPCADN